MYFGEQNRQARKAGLVMMKHKNFNIKIGRTLIGILLVFLITGCSNQDSGVKINRRKIDVVDEMKEQKPKVLLEQLYVQISGAVHNPGVYAVSEGERIFQVIAKAGGLLENAAFDSVNQAMAVKDGQCIHVCTKEEYQESKNQSTQDGTVTKQQVQKVNINHASQEQLMTLPGIGEGKARQIIEYREENGSFETIEAIMKISGIKEHLFEKIKDAICVNE